MAVEITKGSILPQGIDVRTAFELGSTDGMFVSSKNLEARKENVPGKIAGYVPGHGGDVYWIKHEDNTVGAYTEFAITCDHKMV